MNRHTDNFPFYSRIPRPIGVIVLLVMFIPPTFSGGAWISNINEMAGESGLWTEDIQLASFFTSIGMCLFPPFMIRFLQSRKVKQTFLWCFAALIVLNLGCAVTESLPVLLGLCLLTGFVRIIVMLNCTFTIAPYLTGMNTLDMFTMTSELSPEVQYSLERKRTLLMPVLYFYILVISQLSNMVAAWFAYNFSWHDVYYVVTGMLAVAMVLVMCTMKDEERRFDYEPEWDMVPDMIVMGTALCAMSYMLVYGKTMDWFHAREIRISAAIFAISGSLLLWRMSANRDRYYLPPDVFSFRNVGMATILFLITMIFNSANVFVGVYSHLSTPADNLHSAMLGQWAIAGCVAGLAVSLAGIRMKVRFATLFSIAFILMALANAYLYFQYQTIGMFGNMVIPTLLNYTGLLMLYSLVAAFGMKSLPAKYLTAFVFLMIWMRNAIAPVLGTSVYSTCLEERRQYYISRLAGEVTADSDAASSFHDQASRHAFYSGQGTYDAEKSAVSMLKARVSVQSTILAMKDISGQTVILLLVTAVVVLILPYHKGETT